MIRFAIVLTGTVDDVNKPLVEAIVKHLRQFAPDSQLTLERMERGSIVLTFRASRIVYLRLQTWFTSDYRTLLLGMTVQRMFLLPPEGARTSDYGSTARTEQERFADAAALYFAPDEVLGPNWLCTLAAYLNFEDDDLRKATVRLLLNIAHFSETALPLVLTLLGSQDSAMRSFILKELRSHGDLGYAAVPAIVASRFESREAVEAVLSLGYQRPARVAGDALALLATQDSPTYRYVVSSLLERLSRAGAAEPNDAAVQRVVWSLSRMATRAESAYDRIWAIGFLKNLHPMNSSVERALKLIALDERTDMTVCVAAIEGLIEAGDGTDGLAERLSQIIEKSNATDVAEAALRLLALLRSATGDMLDGLIALLSAGHISVRRAAAKVLGSVGYNAATVVPALTRCLSDEDSVVRETAEAGLKRIKDDMQYASLELEGLLAAQDDTIRERARKLLGDLREDEQ